MVPPFAQAVIALKNGERTKTPVQSQFGWHVIEREESRDKAPPAFDTVKEQLTHLVQTKKLQQHITELKAKAKIENKVEAKADAPAAPSVEKAAPAQPAAEPAPAAPQKP